MKAYRVSRCQVCGRAGGAIRDDPKRRTAWNCCGDHFDTPLPDDMPVYDRITGKKLVN